MPYGVSKSIGGDSPANTKFMDACVKAMEGQKDKSGNMMDQGTRIAICKSTLMKHMNKPNTSNKNIMDGNSHMGQ